MTAAVTAPTQEAPKEDASKSKAKPKVVKPTDLGNGLKRYDY